jgi:flagellar hook-associated protein 3 FlgL
LSQAGAWLNRADNTETLLADRALAHRAEQSGLEDLDMVQGISDFQNQQTGLQAALQSYAQVQRLSLFQYIS